MRRSRRDPSPAASLIWYDPRGNSMQGTDQLSTTGPPGLRHFSPLRGRGRRRLSLPRRSGFNMRVTRYPERMSVHEEGRSRRRGVLHSSPSSSACAGPLNAMEVFGRWRCVGEPTGGELFAIELQGLRAFCTPASEAARYLKTLGVSHLHLGRGPPDWVAAGLRVEAPSRTSPSSGAST